MPLFSSKPNKSPRELAKEKFQTEVREIRESCTRTHARCVVFAGLKSSEIKFADDLGRAFDSRQSHFLDVAGELWVLIPTFENRTKKEGEWHKCYLAAYWRNDKWRPSMFLFPPSIECAEEYLIDYKRRSAVDDDVIRVVTNAAPRSQRDSIPSLDDVTITMLIGIERDRLSGKWKEDG